MTILQYTHAKPFLEDCQTYLEQEEAANNLILGFSLPLVPLESAPVGYRFFSVQKGEEAILSAMCTPGRNLLLYGEQRAIPSLVKYLSQNKINLPGVIGERHIAKQFAKQWCENTGQNWAVQFNDIAHQLDQVNSIALSQGFMRLATLEEIDVLEDWGYDFGRIEGETSKVLVRKNILRRINDQHLYVWDDNGPVSMASLARPTRNGTTINYVYTPEAFRKKGYASSCVAALSKEILASGKQFCALFTDEKNPTSNKIYKEIGYKPVMETYVIRFS